MKRQELSKCGLLKNILDISKFFVSDHYMTKKFIKNLAACSVRLFKWKIQKISTFTRWIENHQKNSMRSQGWVVHKYIVNSAMLLLDGYYVFCHFESNRYPFSIREITPTSEVWHYQTGHRRSACWCRLAKLVTAGFSYRSDFPKWKGEKRLITVETHIFL